MNVSTTIDKKAIVSLHKEAHITVLSLLKSFYDEQIFNILIKDFYNSDLDISLAAIRASSSIGNEVAIPHLYRILEHGKPTQKIAAIQTLSDINAPSSIENLVKYFTIFPNLEIRREILKAVNKISPLHPKVHELNKSVLLDPTKGQDFYDIVMPGLLETGDLERVGGSISKVHPEIQRLIFQKLLQSSSQESSAFIESFQTKTSQFDPHTLGCFLCAYELKAASPQQNFTLDTLQSSDLRATTSFLISLDSYKGRIQIPARLFRLLLRLPHVDQETEGINGDFLARIVQEVKSHSPLLLNEFIFTTATHLEAVYAKIKKQYISLKGITERDALLIVLLAKIVERYAAPELLQEVQRFFKADYTESPAGIVEQMRERLRTASEDDRNRFEACIPLFTLSERKAKLNVYQTLARINLSHPALLRRLNRLIRVIGTLEIRNSSKKILEILDFAREERIPFMEETCVVTLCQLLNRTAIEMARGIFQEPAKHLPAIKGYIRGARFLPVKIFLNPLLQLLLNPNLNAQIRALVVSSLKHMDLQGAKGIMPPLIKALKMPEIEKELKQEISDILGEYGDSSLIQPVLDLTSSNEAFVRRTGIRTLRAIAKKEKNLPLDVMTNRLYLLLEDNLKLIQVEALMTLLALGDDYAAQILQDFAAAKDETAIVELLSNLEKPISRELLDLLLKLIFSQSRAIHERLRTALPEFCQGAYAEEIRKTLLDALKGTAAASPLQEEKRSAGLAKDQTDSLIDHAKLEFKFKRENSQMLTVFFTDIVSYTEKSSISDTVTLMKLIQSFEEICLPTITTYKGNLVKKMGDGLLATFKHPLNAVLAALAVQKQIHEHNQYKVEGEKFNVRIGLNSGLVIRKTGDIYGDTVNVASRMETSANPGDIMLTQNTYEEIKDYVRCTRLGDIQVKGKQEAITAYLAEEITVDINQILAGGKEALPASAESGDSLDKLRESIFNPSFTIPEGLRIQRSLLGRLEALFKNLTKAIEDIAKDYHEEYIFKRYLQEEWNQLLKSVEKAGA